MQDKQRARQAFDRSGHIEVVLTHHGLLVKLKRMHQGLAGSTMDDFQTVGALPLLQSGA